MTSDLLEENAALKADNKALREKVHWWKKEVNVAHRARADEFDKIIIENKAVKRKLEEAKEIISSLINNPYIVTVGDIEKARSFIRGK